MKYALFGLIALALIAGIASTFLSPKEEEIIACTMDAMVCADGSMVGRSGPNCEFACPPAPEVPGDIAAQIDAKSDKIKLTGPAPLAVVINPFTISGQARGPWYFEASFPIFLTNWDGLIISQTVAAAQGDWMTEDFVPFVAELDFVNPYKEGDPEFMKRGTLILKKDNPSGLPEHDDALEIPVQFAP
ncbi:Gmad2 immunoglobulin-like domain-containing protein [Patescibacteria group bacterium]|nr:Gmad2 immunoglobulin-like domain-containing protein [Patescibacteria group bacterium]